MQKKVAIVLPGEGEQLVVGAGVDMRILEDGTTTGHRLGIVESTLAPGSDAPPQHRHPAHDEAFYVLSGTIRFTVGTLQVDAAAGTLVTVPPGAPHTFVNLTGDPARMITAFSDARYVGFFRDIARVTDPAQALDLRAKYGTVITDEYA